MKARLYSKIIIIVAVALVITLSILMLTSCAVEYEGSTLVGEYEDSTMVLIGQAPGGNSIYIYEDLYMRCVIVWGNMGCVPKSQ